jgi:hypothetical protein
VIVLLDGNKWILDASEWKSNDISYEDACACKIPIMSYREFVEEIVEATNSSNKFLIPRKHTITKSFPKGYWDANFGVFDEVFPAIASCTNILPWAKVFEMPWGVVYVLYFTANCCGEAEIHVKAYKNIKEYLKITQL